MKYGKSLKCILLIALNLLLVNSQFIDLIGSQTKTYYSKQNHSYNWIWNEYLDAPDSIFGSDIAHFGSSFGPFHNKTELYNKLYSIEENFPNIIEIKEIGRSYLNNSILVVIITNELSTKNKNEFFLVAHHHARELITLENALYFIDRLIFDYIEGDEEIEHILNSKRLHIVPSLNVDALDMLHLRSDQRKNLRPIDEDGDGTIDDTEMLTGVDSSDPDTTIGEDKPGGVDLNRNYPYEWGVQFGTDDPSNEIYRGKYPLSEPETYALASYVRSYNFKAAVTLHAGLATIFTPWFCDPEAECPDHELYSEVGEELESLTGLDFVKLTYNLTGVWLDWMYGGRGIFAVNFETYRNSSSDNLWDWSNPPANEVMGNCENVVYPGLKYMIKFNPPELNILPTENLTTIPTTEEVGNENIINFIVIIGFLILVKKKPSKLKYKSQVMK